MQLCAAANLVGIAHASLQIGEAVNALLKSLHGAV